MIGFVLAPSVLIIWRFVRRARVGARVRALTGTRLPVTEHVAALVADVPVGRIVVCALGGGVVGGWLLAVAGAAAAVAGDPILRARASAKRRAEMEQQMIDVARALGAALRAGRSLPQALEAARDEASDPIRGPLDVCVRRLAVGTPVDDAIALFAARAGIASAESLAETVRIGRLAGSDLPAILDLFADATAEHQRLARDRRAATSQARMSAGFVGAMPVAFFVMAGSGARTQLDVLLRTPLGWVLLAIGVMLEVGGALWMRALLRER